MSAETKPKVALNPSPGRDTTLTSKQASLIVWFAVFAIVAVAALTTILAFHYKTASDATSVLGEVVPIFTAVIGVLVGSGAGVAAGSSGKKAVQSDLNSASNKIQSANRQLDALDVATTRVFGSITGHLTSRSGSSSLYAVQVPDDQPIVDAADIDEIAKTIAYLRGTLDS